IQHKQQSVLVGELAQTRQKSLRRNANAAFALNGLDEKSCRLWTNSRARRAEIAELHLIETGRRRTETVEIFGVAARSECGERATMKGPVEGDEPIALRPAFARVKFPRHLDGAFHRFRTRIAEEDRVGEGVCDQLPGKTLLTRHAIEVGGVPEL